MSNADKTYRRETPDGRVVIAWIEEQESSTIKRGLRVRRYVVKAKSEGLTQQIESQPSPQLCERYLIASGFRIQRHK